MLSTVHFSGHSSLGMSDLRVEPSDRNSEILPPLSDSDLYITVGPQLLRGVDGLIPSTDQDHIGEPLAMIRHQLSGGMVVAAQKYEIPLANELPDIFFGHILGYGHHSNSARVQKSNRLSSLDLSLVTQVLKCHPLGIGRFKLIAIDQKPISPVGRDC